MKKYDLTTRKASIVSSLKQICNKSQIFKSLLYSHNFFWKKPTRCMVMMPIKPSTKIGKFIISGSGFQALGCRQIRLYRRNLLFLQQEQINWIYCYDVLEALYQIFENIDQGQGPGPWVEPILPQWNYLK